MIFFDSLTCAVPVVCSTSLFCNLVQVVAEIVDPNRGLFLSKDGGSTLLPNPHSQLAAGADHLSHFALLGRIAGLALHHGENIPAQFSTGFIKAALGFKICPKDMESVDPVLYQQCVVCIQDGVHQSRDGMALDDPNVVRTFEAEFNFEDCTAKGMAAPAPVELKPGGADITVNEANKAEYLQLFTEHRLVGETRE